MNRYMNRHTYAGVFSMLLLVLFSLISMKIIHKETIFIDELLKGKLQLLQGEGSLAFFEVFTELGSEVGIIGTLVISLLVLWKQKRFSTMLVFVVAVILTNSINKLLKSLVARDRPSINEAVDAIGYSFPSGHAMLSVVTYGFVAFVLVSREMEKTKRNFIFGLFALLILLIGMSRIILSVHYPSDVVGGYCIGGMLLVIFLYADAYALRWQYNKSR